MTEFDETADATVRAAFEAIVLGWPDVSATTMFGLPSYRADGELFAVLHTGGVALTRLSADEREEVAAAFDAGPFDANGRTVTAWSDVPVPSSDDLEALTPYVRASYEAALADAA